MIRSIICIFACIILSSCGSTGTDTAVVDDGRYITLLTTTSTVDSGLLDYINPVFSAETGIDVRVVPMGTGAALRAGENGDGDVLLVHDRDSELKFMAEGHGSVRRELMYNDFVILGPSENPAGIISDEPASSAFSKIADTKAVFVSRGDDSGTHRKEIRTWEGTGRDATEVAGYWIKPPGGWYRPVGQGMGASLTIADELGAYILVDRATYLARRENLQMIILNEGDPVLRNDYGLILVNPEEHPHVRKNHAMLYVNWLTSATGKRLIGAFEIDGEILFRTVEGDE